MDRIMASQYGISTHVLDTRIGKPGRDIEVRLYRIGDGGAELENTARTNEDGRIPSLLPGDLSVGRFRIEFHLYDYAKAQGLESSFFTTLSTEFEVRDANRNYHVPLIISPYSSMTYLGS